MPQAISRRISCIVLHPVKLIREYPSAKTRGHQNTKPKHKTRKLQNVSIDPLERSQ